MTFDLDCPSMSSLVSSSDNSSFHIASELSLFGGALMTPRKWTGLTC